MLLEQTLLRLLELRLDGMASALQERQGIPDIQGLFFDDRLGLLLERQVTVREDRRLTRLLRQAKLRLPASIEDLDLRSPCGLDRSYILRPASSDWVRQHEVVLITGATGTGKTFLACALAQAACRHGLSARYFRLPRILEELARARADGSHPRVLDRLQKTRLIVIDDSGLAPLGESGCRDLLEVLEDRVGRQATLVTSNSPSSTGIKPSGTPPWPMPSSIASFTTLTASSSKEAPCARTNPTPTAHDH